MRWEKECLGCGGVATECNNIHKTVGLWRKKSDKERNAAHERSYRVPLCSNSTARMTCSPTKGLCSVPMASRRAQPEFTRSSK